MFEHMQITLALGAIIAAIIAFFGGRYAYNKEKQENSTKILNSLFGELSHVLQHYSIASAELPQSEKALDERKSLKNKLLWSKFGEFQSSKSFQQFGFLSNVEIRELLQLSFVLRNTDIYIDTLLEDINDINKDDLSSLKNRMQRIVTYSESLLKYMVSINPAFQSALDAAKRIRRAE